MTNQPKIRAALNTIGINPKSYWELRKLGVSEDFTRNLYTLGLLSRKSVPIEGGGGKKLVYWMNEEGRRYLKKDEPPKMPNIAQPRAISVLEGVYKPSPWNVRDGADDHKQYSRRGF